mmetsp:Transcript_9725/g.21084  ORF Transcript_9725/g.21084 Transcript_9725/m.21084 type:complete len:208 (-) Transcript_9725:181-804(-)
MGMKASWSLGIGTKGVFAFSGLIVALMVTGGVTMDGSGRTDNGSWGMDANGVAASLSLAFASLANHDRPGVTVSKAPCNDEEVASTYDFSCSASNSILFASSMTARGSLLCSLSAAILFSISAQSARGFWRLLPAPLPLLLGMATFSSLNPDLDRTTVHVLWFMLLDLVGETVASYPSRFLCRRWHWPVCRMESVQMEKQKFTFGTT